MKLFSNLHNLWMRKPTFVNIDVTYSCPLNCITCTRGGNITYENELTLEEYVKIFRALRDWNVHEAAFVGGEPFIKKEIFSILKSSLDHGIHPKPVSNGFLINKNTIAELRQIGVKSITLSLNSLNPSIHDLTRGRSGSYQKIMDSLPLLLKNGIEVIIMTVLLKQNIKTIPELIEWAKKRGVQIQFQIFVSPEFMFYAYSNESAFNQGNMDFDKDWLMKSPYWIQNIKDFQRVMDTIIFLKETKKYPINNPIKQLQYFKIYYQTPNKILNFKCKVGNNNLSIDPYGNVRLCFAMPPVGNVRKTDLHDIWTSTEAEITRRNIAKCTLNCKLMQCNY